MLLTVSPAELAALGAFLVGGLVGLDLIVNRRVRALRADVEDLRAQHARQASQLDWVRARADRAPQPVVIQAPAPARYATEESLAAERDHVLGLDFSHRGERWGAAGPQEPLRTPANRNATIINTPSPEPLTRVRSALADLRETAAMARLQEIADQLPPGDPLVAHSMDFVRRLYEPTERTPAPGEPDYNAEHDLRHGRGLTPITSAGPDGDDVQVWKLDPLEAARLQDAGGHYTDRPSAWDRLLDE